MSKYIIRLDDACEKMDVEKWDRMEKLLDKFKVKPLVGVIPHCEDPMMDKYESDAEFWNKVEIWKNKGWTVAMHGYNHVYSTTCGGINPVNKRSEFAGLSYEEQSKKIERGWKTLNDHGFHPEVFFAPSHTFDENTLKALKEKTTIRVISDTIANDVYKKDDFWFIPQQSGSVRKLPLRTVTFCYHPNTMTDKSFEVLEAFLKSNHGSFIGYPELKMKDRKTSAWDKVLRWIYFVKH